MIDNHPAVVGARIGRAIARDTIADGYECFWSGLDALDGDQLLAVGIKPHTPEWAVAEAAAQKAFIDAFIQS